VFQFLNFTWPQVDMWVIVLILICVIAFLAFATQRAVRAHRHQASAGREDLIGKIAEVRTSLNPKGVVFVEGERWTAISDKEQIESGEEVIITKVDGLKLYVTKKQ
jgi:membrane-bound ClpP family serine protease